jgi:hypothetical protein
LAKYLCRSYDNRWSSSRQWLDIPEDSRREWFAEAAALIEYMESKSQAWRAEVWLPEE